MEKCEIRKEGFRFWLRPCEEGDVPALAAAAQESRERVGAWMDWLTPSYGMNEAREWVRMSSANRKKGLSYECVMIDSMDGTVSGCCGLNRINDKDLVCNLGYWVRESKVRIGAAREAVLLLKEFGMEALGLRRIEIVVADGNAASRAVAESVGAEYEGIQRKRLKVGVHSHDAHMYALFAE